MMLTVDWLQGGSRDARICGRMECWIAELKQCFASSEQRAFEKTSCANNKWCVRGHCVHDSAALQTRGLSLQYFRSKYLWCGTPQSTHHPHPTFCRSSQNKIIRTCKQLK